MIKITGGQRIDLLGVRKEDLPGVWADLDMPSGYAYGKSFRTVKTCVGTDFCRFGLGDSTELGDRARAALPGPGEPGEDEAGRGRVPAQLLGGAGQGRRRGRGRRRPVGRLHRRRGGGVGAQGRRAGHRRRARRGASGSPGVFMQYYRENAKLAGAHLRLRAAGRARRAQGDAGRRPRRASSPAWRSACRRAIDAYRDPWQDGREPSGPGQFADNLPLIPLPIVPVAAGARREPAGVVGGSRAGGERTVRRAARGTVSELSEGGAGMTTSEITEHAVAPDDDLPAGGARAYAVGDAMVAVFRLRSGELRAVDAVCPHSGGPLADGQFDAKKVICPLHNYLSRWRTARA